MSKYKIYGGNKLNGSIKVPVSKNSTLPILAASILCKKEVVLNNLPNFTDVLKIEVYSALNKIEEAKKIYSKLKNVSTDLDDEIDDYIRIGGLI